jgi:NADH:ubiquinone oxidoreductase subunit 2 (subunit N)
VLSSLVSSILVCYLGQIYLSKQSLPKTEFYTLVLIIAAAMMLLIQSANFVILFVALETVDGLPSTCWLPIAAPVKARSKVG